MLRPRPSTAKAESRRSATHHGTPGLRALALVISRKKLRKGRTAPPQWRRRSRSGTLPARDREAVQVHRCRTRTATIHLEVGDQGRIPSQHESGEPAYVQRLLRAIQPDRVIRNRPAAVVGIGDLNVMPGVAAPVRGIARLRCVGPLVDRARRAARVDRIVPRSVPSVALESKDDRLAVGHRLIHVHLDVGNRPGSARDVYPSVVQEVG